VLYIRYVLARPVLPKNAKILSGPKAAPRVSNAKNQDTTAEMYRLAHSNLGTEPDPDTLAHYEQRDKHAWIHSVTCPVEESEMMQLGYEFGRITRNMRIKEGDVPHRNLWACTRPRCDWSDLCHGNPSGDIDNWWGITTSDYDGLASYVVRYQGREDKLLERNKPGKVVTASEVRNFLTCPRKWYFENVKNAGRSERSYAQYSARWKGNMVHKYAELMAHADMGLMPHTAIGPMWDEFIQGYVDQLNDHSEKEQLMIDADVCWQVAINMYELARAPLSSAPHVLQVEHAEQRFAAVLPGTKTWITCQPDLVCSDGKDTVIVDYKTLSSSNLVRDAHNYIHLPSMYLYALAVTDGFKARKVEQ
jgi:hypothetical protein